MSKFDLNSIFPSVEVRVERWTCSGGIEYVNKFKRIQLCEGLSLSIYDNKETVLTFENDDDSVYLVFDWDDEVKEMFEQFDEVRAVDLFEMIYRKNWRTG